MTEEMLAEVMEELHRINRTLSNLESRMDKIEEKHSDLEVEMSYLAAGIMDGEIPTIDEDDF